jgi:hypothetical protein
MDCPAVSGLPPAELAADLAPADRRLSLPELSLKQPGRPPDLGPSATVGSFTAMGVFDAPPG